MPASGPSITDIKFLFARSGNRCAFPKCRAPMALDSTLTAEVCHIKGMRPGSARYDATQTDAQRHAYENLVLMCPTHHTVIDDDEEAYSVERLFKIKASHEAQATPIPDSEASAVAELFIESIMNIGQSGGLSAHTVTAETINVQSAPSTSYLTRQRQIQAVERLWQIVRNLRSELSAVVLLDTLLTPQELDAYFRGGANAHIADCVREYADLKLAVNKLGSTGIKDADKERLFVTRRLWSVFYVLQAIYGRSALLLTNSYKEHRFVNWRMDSGCDQFLRAVLPAQLVEQVKGQEIGGLHTAIDYLESQFLSEAGMNESHT